MTEDAIRPFRVAVPDEVVTDLRARLARTRWPDQIPDAGWDYGTERSVLQELCAHWADGYDWNSFAQRHNRFEQFVTTIDGLAIHFVHARSPEATARPLLITHGWPGSFTELLDVIGPLSDPVAHGGEAADAFHVVVPSLPGYGFSAPPRVRGWDLHRAAESSVTLMERLGYDRFLAQGGDWGAGATMALGTHHADRVIAIHVNLLTAVEPQDAGELPVTPAEHEARERARRFLAEETGYQAIQSTKPQTLAYGLTDSPAGLAGWILEKFRTWSDCGGDVRNSFSFDRLLDNISVYWLSGSIGSSMRLYYETLGPKRTAPRRPPALVSVPLGHSVFPAEIYQCPRSWAEALYDVVYWNELPRGGHFAAMEVPGTFVDEVRACFRGR